MTTEETTEVILPCINCITLPICRNFYFSEGPLKVFTRMAMADRCSLLDSFMQKINLHLSKSSSVKVRNEFHYFMLGSRINEYVSEYSIATREEAV